MSSRRQWWTNQVRGSGFLWCRSDSTAVALASVSEGVGEECAAVLAGRYVEYLAQNRSTVPVWAWTNLLAHGTETELRQLAVTSGAAALAADNGWHRARRYLAGEVLDWAERLGSLVELQKRVLIPLELDLAGCGSVSSWRPATWVANVLVALQQSTR